MSTSYYVSYRGSDGKPIEKRFDSENIDDTFRKGMEIKEKLDLNKKGKNMRTTLSKPIKEVLTNVNEKKNSSGSLSKKTMQEHQAVISSYNGVAIVSLIDIVAFDDINILYGYETGARIVSEMQTMIEDTLETMDANGVFLKHSVKVFSYEMYDVHADKLCLFIKHDLNHRLLDLIIKQLSKNISKHKFLVSDESHIHINTTFGATKSEGSMSLLYAEKALQEAKKSHNSYVFYDGHSIGTNKHILNNVYGTLLDNIKQETVTPYFQGIFDVDNYTVPYKFESLMRLVDSEGRVLSPEVFMEKSKEYRLYTQLMSQMIEKVFDVMKKHDV
ncbi:MAG: EAL domain-containing protein, partial [Sulfurovum sp.]|nr:EAL domain-containing protein [Sulfurovum sp.]NNJ45727.1 EAL domain-containing protein [Sulfurovum sp.]